MAKIWPYNQIAPFGFLKNPQAFENPKAPKWACSEQDARMGITASDERARGLRIFKSPRIFQKSKRGNLVIRPNFGPVSSIL